MSILRLSVLKDTAYAPLPEGTILMEDYAGGNKANLRGRLDRLSYETQRQVLDRDPAAFERMAPNLQHYFERAVPARTSDLRPGAPVVVMVHGFLFDPRQAVGDDPKESDNPHGRLYHFVEGDEGEEQRHHTSSWPLHLGFSLDDVTGSQGFAIAFGWHSQPGFASSLINHFQNFYARAYDYAGQTAWVLVHVLDRLSQVLPGHPIDLFCHSLGSRVVVRALQMACSYRPSLLPRLGRVLLLGGAEYVVEAQVMMRRLLDGNFQSLPSFYNIVSRENDVLDKLGENFGPRTFGNSQVIGHNGLEAGQKNPNWMDLRIDGREVQEWMEPRGFQVSGDRPGNIWDHWYYYTFRGNMRLYREILRNREDWTLGALRGQGIPEGAPRGIFGD